MTTNIREKLSERSLGMMNATTALVVVFALLFIFLHLARTLAEQQKKIEEGEKRPPCPQCQVCIDCPPQPTNDQPPIIQLSEAQGYSFTTGSAEISPKFQEALRKEIIPKLVELGKQYNCNVIDCIGHTDEQKVSKTSKPSNLDELLLQRMTSQGRTTQLVPGSNADLGLMRCWEVINFLKADGRLTGFTLYGYSAGQTVLPSGQIAESGRGPKDDETRRRIEIRLRRLPGQKTETPRQSVSRDVWIETPQGQQDNWEMGG